MRLPQLTAIALQDQWFDRDIRAQFWRDARAFWQTAEHFALRSLIQLRAHDLSLTQWQQVLQSRPNDLRSFRLGISFPAQDSADLQQVAAALAAHSVDVVHFSERAAALSPALSPLLCAGLAVSRSCHDLHGVRAAVVGDFSWAWLSPIYATPAKPATAALGLAILAATAKEIPNYLCALGGIDAQNAAATLAAGAAGLVCHRTAWSADSEKLCRTVAQALRLTVV